MTFLDYQCLHANLPAPVREFRFAPPRRWRFDHAWPELKIALEQEGGVWTRGRHTRGKGYVADLEKYNEAACLGWTVIRATPQQVQDGTAFQWVQRAFARGRKPSAVVLEAFKTGRRGKIWSLAQLAATTGLTVSTVCNAVGYLRRTGAICVERVTFGNGGAGRTLRAWLAE